MPSVIEFLGERAITLSFHIKPYRAFFPHPGAIALF
jgi:hypothetical protein